MRKKSWSMGTAFAFAAITMIVVIMACQPQQTQSGRPSRHTIVVYGFSVEEEVLTKEIFPAFKSYWQQQTAEEVNFQGVFTGSEEIADAILNGAPADVAVLSNEQHAVWLQINDRVVTDWHDLPHEGVLSESPIVIVVRPGNPLGIKDWVDLTRPGVGVVHANPRTSGGAQWALLAEYGSALDTGKDEEAAATQLCAIWANVVSSPSSSREALRQFLFGVGDALITYEQDALLAQSRGAGIELIMPRSTIISEHVAVIVDRNVASWERESVEAFISFLWSETAQRAFVDYYFRPVTADGLAYLVEREEQQRPDAPAFAEIERPFTVRDLGGWERVYPEIIQGVWEEKIASSGNMGVLER
jgi:sulfate/thiosulfate-binding protein